MTAAIRLSLAVQYALSPRQLPSRVQFRTWVRAALEHDATVTIRLIGLREGRVLNRSYRKKDYATNVLTFVFSDQTPFEGDIALCAPVVAREAREQGKPLNAHWAHMVVHGVLHLLGYDHIKLRDAKRMEALEVEILARFGYQDPYVL